MKDADAWFAEGMKNVELSWHADYQSELKGDLEDAIANFDRALALQPEHADVWFQKGLALARLSRHDEAAGALAEAVRLRPDETERWLQKAKSLAQLGRHEGALAAFDETLRRRPDDPDARYGRAESLEALKRNAVALAAWEEVLRAPDLRTMDFHMRQVRVVTGDFRRVRARVSRANALARVGRRAEAASAYRDVIGGEWQALHGPLAPAVFHEALRQLEPARSAYHAMLQEKGDDPNACRCAGDAFLRAGRSQEAIEACEKMLRLAPEDAVGWWSLAEALVQSGRRDEAGTAYREALRIRPGYLAVSARLKVVLEGIEAMNADPKRKSGKWKVMGRDTFSREDYVVGEYATEEEARKRMRESESRAEKAQDEALRDSYWIVPPS